MPFWPLLTYGIFVFLLVATILAVSAVLGERHQARDGGSPYESGIVPTRETPPRYTAQYYAVAALFLIFDLEAVFVFTWALVARDVGWTAYVEIAVFIGVLIIGLVYLVRAGALDWGPRAFPRRGSS